MDMFGNRPGFPPGQLTLNPFGNQNIVQGQQMPSVPQDNSVVNQPLTFPEAIPSGTVPNPVIFPPPVPSGSVPNPVVFPSPVPSGSVPLPGTSSTPDVQNVPASGNNETAPPPVQPSPQQTSPSSNETAKMLRIKSEMVDSVASPTIRRKPLNCTLCESRFHSLFSLDIHMKGHPEVIFFALQLLEEDATPREGPDDLVPGDMLSFGDAIHGNKREQHMDEEDLPEIQSDLTPGRKRIRIQNVIESDDETEVKAPPKKKRGRPSGRGRGRPPKYPSAAIPSSSGADKPSQSLKQEEDEDYEATQDDDEDEEYRPSTAERKTAMPKKRRTRSKHMDPSVVPVILTPAPPVVPEPLSKTDRIRACKLRKKLESRQRNKEYYEKNRWKLKQKRDAKRPKKVYPEDVKPWDELTPHEKKKARQREQYKNRKVKKMIEEQKLQEKREKDRKRKQRARLRDRLEQEYLLSKLEAGISQDEVLERENIGEDTENKDGEKSDGEDVDYLVVKQEDSSGLSDVEESEEGSSHVESAVVEDSVSQHEGAPAAKKGVTASRMPRVVLKDVMKRLKEEVEEVKSESDSESEESEDSGDSEMDPIVKEELID